MITNFFKPKSSKKITPEPSNNSSTSSRMAKKRTWNDDEPQTQSSSKRSKESMDQDIDNSPVQELLSYLKTPEKKSDDDTPDNTWTEVLGKHFSSPSFERLANFVSAQRYVFFYDRRNQSCPSFIATGFVLFRSHYFRVHQTRPNRRGNHDVVVSLPNRYIPQPRIPSRL